MVACGTLWWFAVVCGGLSIDVIPTDLNNNWTDKLHQVTAASTEARGSDIP